MSPKNIEISELTERKQLLRLHFGRTCFAVGAIIGALGIVAGIFIAGATKADPATLSLVTFPPVIFGGLIVIAGIYPFLRGRGKTKRQCWHLLTIGAAISIGVIALAALIGWLLPF